MNEELAIEKGIAIPPVPRGVGKRSSKYPLGQMDIGDSYFVACVSRQERVSIASAAHKWGKYHGRTFTTRRTGDGIRVWRLS